MPKAAGAHSLAEILSQPQFWGQCLAALEKEGSLADVRNPFRSAQEWLFIGCGSSYYLALAAAASWSAITGIHGRGQSQLRSCCSFQKWFSPERKTLPPS